MPHLIISSDNRLAGYTAIAVDIFAQPLKAVYPTYPIGILANILNRAVDSRAGTSLSPGHPKIPGPVKFCGFAADLRMSRLERGRVDQSCPSGNGCGPARCSHSVEILDVAPLRLRFQSRCGRIRTTIHHFRMDTK